MHHSLLSSWQPRHLPWRWALGLGLLITGVVSGASWDPVEDISLGEDAPPREIRLGFHPDPLPASAYRFEVTSDHPTLLPPAALDLRGQPPHPVLRLHPAADAFGEARITLRAIAEGVEPVEIAFRLTVVAVDDPPRIRPVANQALIEGMPTLQVPVEVTDPDGSFQLTVQASDGGRWLRVGVSGGEARRFVEITPLANLNRPLVAPARVAVTLRAVSGRLRTESIFYVTLRPREFSPTGSSFPVPGIWQPLTLPLDVAPRFVWSDPNGDGYADLTSYGSMGVRWTAPQNGGGGLTAFGRGFLNRGLTAAAWGDLDGNGTLEAFVSGGGVFGIYRLLRATQAPPMTNRLEALASLAVEGAAWADLDGNGTLDLVYTGVTNETRQVVLALNDGLGNLTMVPHTLPKVAGPVVAADFNRDGRADLLLCDNSARGTPAHLFFNQGDARFAEGPVVAAGDPVTGAGTADVNGDGVPDLWLVQAVNRNRRTLELNVLVQQSETFRRTFHLPVEQFAGAGEPSWGDLDHDGRVDFVAPFQDRVWVEGGREVTTNRFAVYHNRGGGQFERGDPLFSPPVVAPSPLPGFVPALGDVDQDGDLDVVGYDRGYGVFYNQRRNPNYAPEAPSGLRGLILGDEVFLFWSPATDANQTAPLTYNVRVGSAPGANDLVASQSATNGVRQVFANGNAGFLHSYSFRVSRQDLARIHWSVQAVDASHSGGPFAPEQSLGVEFPGNQPPRIVAPAALELTEDTPTRVEVQMDDDRTPPEALVLGVSVEPDTLLSATWDRLQPGAPPESPRGLRLLPHPNATGSGTVTLQATDRNGASSQHVIAVTVTPENDAPMITAEVPRIALRGRPIRGVVHVEDVETDPAGLQVSARSSHPELLPDSGIAVSGSGAQRELVATPSAGAAGVVEVTLTVTDPEGRSADTSLTLRWQDQLMQDEPLSEALPSMSLVRVMDLEGDGLQDLVGVDAATPGDVMVWRQAPRGVWKSVLQWSTGVTIAGWIPADFDNDGDADLLAHAPPGVGGITVLILWNDSGRLGRSTALLTNEGLHRVAVLDVDQDGDTDVVAGTSGTALQLWRHPGGVPDAAAASRWESFPLENPAALSLGLQGDSFLLELLPTDVNGDGLMDLLLARTGEPASARGLVLRQQDSGGFTVHRPPWTPSAVPLDVADFDNDGLSDTLVVYPPGSNIPHRVFLGPLLWAGIGSLAIPRALGDLDGDGAEDVWVWTSGTNSFGLLSAVASPEPRFTPQPVTGSPSLDSIGSVDLDADGRLDLVGLRSGQVWISRNLGFSSNQPPSIPSNLRVERSASTEIDLVWDAPRDAEQASGLTYTIRVGTSPGAGDVVSALATAEGLGLLPGRGNAGGRGRFRLRGLTLGVAYYWSVQAVDAGFARSAFAAESTFRLTSLPEISPIADLVLPLSAGEQSVPFQVSDAETPASALQVAVTSSNPVLLPSPRLSLSGDAEARTLRLHPKPERAGTSEVTVRVTDGELLVVERRFTVSVPSPIGYAATTNWGVELAAGGSVELLLNGFDPEGDFLEYQVGTPRHGTIVGRGPRITYQAEPGYTGTDSIEFVATTPGSWPARGVITIQIEPPYRLRPEVRLASFGLPPRWQLVFRGRAGSRVVLEQSRDLRTWEPLGEHEFPANEALSVPPPDLAEDAVRFFRLVEPSR